MSTKPNFVRDSYTGIAFPAGKDLSSKKVAYSMKRSYRILIGGLTLGWITCMAIILSSVLQG